MKITGKVVHGKQLGRTLGFPTANIQPEAPIQDCMDGVYAAWFHWRDKAIPCMVNIGSHPTLPDGGRTVEAHLFHFSGDLYGQHVCVETTVLLRREVKFASPEALRRQLQQDRQAAIEILNRQAPTQFE